jgi:ABC-type glutathione transport system ATPase component
MLLTVRNLYFGYSSVNPLFRNLNLSVEKGRIIALAGESGCGKSTFSILSMVLLIGKVAKFS